MTPLERVGTVLQGGIPDRVPAAPLICGAARRVYGVTYEEWAQDGELMAKSMVQAQELIGFDGILGLVDLSVEAADLGQKMVYPVEDTPHPDYDDPCIKTPDDYLKIERIDPTKSPRMKEMLTYMDIICNEKAATVPIMGFVYGPLGILSMMRGAENVFRDCYKNKEAVIKAEEVITEVLVDYIKAMCKTGVHAIVLDTLFASQTIMRKEMWREIEGPHTKVLADTIRECGAMVMVHNCGNGIYFDVQIEMMDPVAISFAYPPDDCKDMKEAKEKWGKKVCLCGYASPAQYAFLGSPEEMKAECKKEIEELGKDGGFILATGCEFPPNGSLMNAIAMMEAAELYGKY
ncbi:MAG: uroporphyrinogen decarboxylase family protein [Desulfobacterales bacterium]|jgi:uroporphyrinogen decarboxylase